MAIISFEYNFIFIKTRKTAGTSIEVDLSKRVEAQAIVTPILPREDGHIARNYQNELGESLYFNHMAAVQIRDLLGAEKFASMYKFCVERDPITKSLSHYHMYQNSRLHNKAGNIITWNDYCAANNFPTDHNKYSETINGQAVSVVDEFLSYESLDTELPKLLAQLGMSDFKLTTRAKSEYSKKTLVREDDITQAQRLQIRKAFQTSLALTGLYPES